MLVQLLISGLILPEKRDLLVLVNQIESLLVLRHGIPLRKVCQIPQDVGAFANSVLSAEWTPLLIAQLKALV